jgi:hypothetical protein
MGQTFEHGVQSNVEKLWGQLMEKLSNSFKKFFKSFLGFQWVFFTFLQK